MILGGRAAEEIKFGDITTGAQDDLKKATSLARKMVTEYGMSDKLGPRTFGQKQEMVFLGKEISEHRDYSDQIAQQIDEEVHNRIQRAYGTAKRLLEDNAGKLQELAELLLEKETLVEEDLASIFGRVETQPVAA
jgi:cell division protease FtsH